MGTTFEGRFAPPAMGTERAPVPIAGPGRLEIDAQGVTVSAFRARSQTLKVLGVLAVCVALAGAWMSIEGVVGRTLACAVLGAVASVLLHSGGGKHDASAPVAFTVPWTHVGNVLPDGPHGIQIQLEKYRPAARPPVAVQENGVIHFAPAAGAAPILQALAAARG